MKKTDNKKENKNKNNKYSFQLTRTKITGGRMVNGRAGSSLTSSWDLPGTLE